MVQQVDVSATKALGLEDYGAHAHFAGAVAALRTEAARAQKVLAGRKVWMVNSTAQGGGVAEMLPRLVLIMNELGIDTRWAVIESDDVAFFRLTKKLHNLIHDNAPDGIELGPSDAALLQKVNEENAKALRQHLSPQDLLVVHDPQPVALGGIFKRELGVRTLWRCHIGLDARTDATRSAWTFLKPYLKDYDHAAFSVPEYLPSYLAGRASILYPGLDPLSHKNRDLSVSKLVGILVNSGMQDGQGGVPTPDYEHQVRQLMPDGSAERPLDLGLLFRPIVLQVSRWDKLKGWAPLIEAFRLLKERAARGGCKGLAERNCERLKLARLVLAGPDPASIQDDPEGLEVFSALTRQYAALSDELKRDVAILVLPMESRKENSLIVNALQRCASVVVQNSLREGFGLTVTEAMWKHQAVLGTHACGVKLQVRDGIDGKLTDNAEDPKEIAEHLFDMLVHPRERFLMGRSAQRRVYDNFLVFNQISTYMRMLTELAEQRG